MNAFQTAYHTHGKALLSWLGFGFAILAGVLEAVPDLGVPAPVNGLLLWGGTTLAGTAFIKQAETAFGKWLAGGGGIALATAGQYLLQAYPGNRYAEVGGMLAMGVGGLWKGALSHRPKRERVSVVDDDLTPTGFKHPPAPPT